MVIEQLHTCPCGDVMLTDDVVLQRQFDHDHAGCPHEPVTGAQSDEHPAPGESLPPEPVRPAERRTGREEDV